MTEQELHTIVVILREDVDRLKQEHKKRLDVAEAEIHEIKLSVGRMEMIDKNIFEKLSNVVSLLEAHKQTFYEHDRNEMEKYKTIDNRLLRLERIMWAGFGIWLSLEFLAKYNLLNMG